MTTPIEVLRESIKAVPAVKYALGIAGIAAAIAIIKSFGFEDYRVAVFGTIIMLLLMVVLVVFARLSTLAGSDFRLPALVFTWFSLLLVIATSVTLFTSVFFAKPVDLQEWLTSRSMKQTTPATMTKQEAPPERKEPRQQAPVSVPKPPPAVRETPRPQPPAVQKPAPESRETATIFQQIRGRWLATDSRSRSIFDQPGLLGRCTLRGKSREVLSIASADLAANQLNGTFESDADVLAQYTPAGGNMPAEVPLAECQKQVTGSPDQSDSVLRRRGTLVLEVGPGKSPRIRMLITTTDCDKDGAPCPSRLFGRQNSERVEVIGDDVLKVGDKVFRRN